MSTFFFHLFHLLSHFLHVFFDWFYEFFIVWTYVEYVVLFVHIATDCTLNEKGIIKLSLFNDHIDYHAHSIVIFGRKVLLSLLFRDFLLKPHFDFKGFEGQRFLKHKIHPILALSLLSLLSFALGLLNFALVC